MLATPGVTDVLVNGPDSVWLDRGRGMERTAVRFADDAAVRRLAQRLAGSAGRRLDDALPFVDAVLADGTRLHAVLPPLATHTTICLRVLARRRLSLHDLVAADAMPEAIADLFRALIASRVAFVVTGGTGSGKTTLLGALLAEAPRTERLLVIEDAPELVVDHPHLVRLVCRGANVEGAGAVGLRELVRQALRMRPDRLVVGEFRGAEVVDLLVALNTGHEGGAATLHANSASDVPARFAALGALAGLPAAAVTSLVASAVEVVVHLRRGTGGIRHVAEIGVLSRLGSELVVSPAWSATAGQGPARRRAVDPARTPSRGMTLAWVAFAGAVLLPAAPRTAPQRLRALGVAGRVGGRPPRTGWQVAHARAVGTSLVQLRGSRRAIGSLVAAGAAAAGWWLGRTPVAIAAVALALTGWRLVLDAVDRRTVAAAAASLLTAVRVLVAELAAGSRPGSALAAAALCGGAHERTFTAAAVAADHGDDAATAFGGSPETAALAAAWSLGQDTGAPLGAVLERVAADLAARAEQRRAVAVALSGPRASTVVLAGLPAVGLTLGVAMGARPGEVLLATPAGRVVCCVGVLLDVAGMWWVRRIVRSAEAAP